VPTKLVRPVKLVISIIGWEVMKPAYTHNQVPEPLDVKTEEAVDAGAIESHGHVSNVYRKSVWQLNNRIPF